MNKSNIKGEIFGKLLVLDFDSTKNKHSMWKCLCRCGNIKVVGGSNLLSGKTKSCGCQQGGKRNILGKRYGRLVVVRELYYNYLSINSTNWLCKCDCGKYKIIRTTSLISKHTMSCGCLHDEVALKNLNISVNPHLTNGADEQRKTMEYIKWKFGVWKRDNYICKVCGTGNTYIVAHHKDGFNYAVNKRTDVDNGVTMCRKCHNDFHRIYGKGNNTKEQFEVYYDTK